MVNDPSKNGRVDESVRLLLDVQRPNAPPEEVYVHDGLTIGRTVANTIVLPDDPNVNRTHARVAIRIDGTAVGRCGDGDGFFRVDGRDVRELQIEPGVRFRIGTTRFTCREVRRESPRSAASADSGCPHCGSEVRVAPDQAVATCAACHENLLRIPSGKGDSSAFVPVSYGDYRAETFADRGGMGIVLRGTEQRTGRGVAIKLLASATDADAARFEREAEMLAAVRHPQVVSLVSHGRSGSTPYLIMDWIDGSTLRDVIAEAWFRNELVDFDAARKWMNEVCAGLAALHERGIVHRDIKPSNILIDGSDCALVSDLGIARPLESLAGGVTTTGQAPGTFAYMAPEQLESPETIDGRADLYSLGVTVHELLTGGRPMGRWKPVSQVNKTVPAWFDGVLNRLLASDPAERFETAGDVVRALASSEGDARTEEDPPRWAMNLAGAILGGFVATITGLFVGISPLYAAPFGAAIGGCAVIILRPPCDSSSRPT